jgi:hypothetical protein
MSRYNRNSHARSTRCTVELLGGEFCDTDRAPDMPFAICARHAIQVYRRLHEMVGEVKGKHHEYPELHDAVVGAVRDERLALRHSVYYVRVGDLIKIGKTTQLRQRLLNYPPGSELLGVEYGSGDIEAMRLHQFRHLLAERKEWFRPGEDLLAHIATLKAA